MTLGQKRNLSLEWKSCERPKHPPTQTCLPLFTTALDRCFQKWRLIGHYSTKPGGVTDQTAVIHLLRQRNTTTQYQICQQINKNVFLGLTKDSTHGNGLDINRPQDKRHTLQHKIWSGCFWKMYFLTLSPRLFLRHPRKARSAIVQTSVSQRKAAQHSPLLFLYFWSFD